MCVGCLDSYTASVSVVSVYTLSERAKPKPWLGKLLDWVWSHQVLNVLTGAGAGADEWSVEVIHLIDEIF